MVGRDSKQKKLVWLIEFRSPQREGQATIVTESSSSKDDAGDFSSLERVLLPPQCLSAQRGAPSPASSSYLPHSFQPMIQPPTQPPLRNRTGSDCVLCLPWDQSLCPGIWDTEITESESCTHPCRRMGPGLITAHQ